MRAGTSCAYMERRNARSCPNAEAALAHGADDQDNPKPPLSTVRHYAFAFISPGLSIASPRSPAISGARVGSMISRGSTKSGPLLCFGNVSHAGSFLKSAPGKRPQRGGGERWGHRVWLCSTPRGGRGRERSLIKPAQAGSAAMVSIDHPWKFSTASDLF